MKYVIVNEHTLGILKAGPGPGKAQSLSVLHGLVAIGGWDWQDSPRLLGNMDTIRPATVADFAQYRVRVPPDFRD